MSSSLRFNVDFQSPLANCDRVKIQKLVDEANRHPIACQTLEYGGEIFEFYPSENDATHLEGSIGLPVELYAEDFEDFLVAVEHWLDLLGCLRTKLPLGEWTVEIDGKILRFDERKGSYIF